MSKRNSQSSVTVFSLGSGLSIHCNWDKTRNGFKHTAALMIDGHEVDHTKVCYLNRTWESYEYQSVIHKLIDQTRHLTKEQKATAKASVDAQGRGEAERSFSMIAAVAKLGDILCPSQADKNAWKKRMLKAGLGEAVDFPEDWDTLTEEEKARRLNSAMEALK